LSVNSAHACSEIGLKWFLFTLHDSETALGFVSVLDFSGDFVFLEHRRNRQTGIKIIFDHFRNTHARYDGYPSGGNYWSDYIGIDANHDGIGDTPYTIDANNIDRYPPWWYLGDKRFTMLE